MLPSFRNFAIHQHQLIIRNILTGIIMTSFIPSALALEMSIIPLNNANAEQLIPVIQAQLNDDSSVSTYQNQIILNASREETIKIKSLINTLDIAGKQLLISVKNNNRGTATIQEGSINNPNNSGIIIQKNGLATKTTTTIQHRTMNNTGSNQQKIRATEGQPGFISTGQSRTYLQPAIDSNGNIMQTQEWKNAGTGFYATTWVNGNTVSIQIEQQKQDFNQDESMNSQQLNTQVTGLLGEWIAIGNLDSQQTTSSRSLNAIERTKEVQNGIIYLKVELSE